MQLLKYLNRNIVILFFLTIILAGCGKSISGVYYKAYNNQRLGKEVILSITDDGLADMTTVYFNGYVSTQYYTISKISKNRFLFSSMEMDVNDIPFFLERKNSGDTSEACLKINKLYPFLKWTLVMSDNEIEIQEGDQLSLPYKNIHCRLRGVKANDSLFLLHDTVFTRQFELSTKGQYLLSLDDRFVGMPFYKNIGINDTAVFYSPDVVVIKRHNFILLKKSKARKPLIGKKTVILPNYMY